MNFPRTEEELELHILLAKIVESEQVWAKCQDKQNQLEQRNILDQCKKEYLVYVNKIPKQ